MNPERLAAALIEELTETIKAQGKPGDVFQFRCALKYLEDGTVTTNVEKMGIWLQDRTKPPEQP